MTVTPRPYGGGVSSLKRCKKCGEVKPLDDFYRAKGMKDGRRSDCKPCNLAEKAERYRQNPEPYIERTKTWQRENREKYNAKQRKWKADHRDRERDGYLRRKYGISQADYDAMLEAQGGGCGICGDAPPDDVAFHVDHDHRTGEVRGLLCVNCNNGLGQFRESKGRLAGAAEYVAAGGPVLLHVVEETRLARERAALLAGARNAAV